MGVGIGCNEKSIECLLGGNVALHIRQGVYIILYIHNFTSVFTCILQCVNCLTPTLNVASNFPRVTWIILLEVSLIFLLCHKD